jgi:nicotinamide mononucleotide transporter
MSDDGPRLKPARGGDVAHGDRHDFEVGQPWRRVAAVEGGGWNRQGAAWTTTAFACRVSTASEAAEPLPAPGRRIAVEPASAPALAVESLAVALTLLCVWLTAEEHVLCWPAGILGSLLYVSLFYRTRLYSDVLLQVYFVVTSVYGWYAWTHGGGTPGAELAVSRLPAAAAALWLGAGVVATAWLGSFMRRYTRAALPYWDATIAVLSLVAQYLLARKVLESWVLWIAVDAMAIGVYLARRLRLTALLYAVLLALAVRGLVSWLGRL